MTNFLIEQSQNVPAVPLDVPGATPNGVFTQILNLDPARGMTAIIVKIAAGARIPAHFHRKGAESHFLLEGDLIENGQTLGPGAFLTHASGVVHGPHESKNGCSILTFQEAFVDPNDPDFYLAN